MSHVRNRRIRTCVRTGACRAIAIVGATIFLVLLGYLWPARVGGSTSLVVVSGESMEPTLHTGDLLVVREGTPDIGDVITFRVPGRDGLIVHRVVERRLDGTLVVQGDNRDTPDMPMPTDADVVGVQSFLVPRGAIWLEILTSPLVLGVGTACAIVAVGVDQHRKDCERARRQLQTARRRALELAGRGPDVVSRH